MFSYPHSFPHAILNPPPAMMMVGMTAAEERALLVGILKLAQDQTQKAYAACTVSQLH